MRDSKNLELLSPTQITLKRDISYNEQFVLAKESEEALLYRDMQSDLVQQILRRHGRHQTGHDRRYRGQACRTCCQVSDTRAMQLRPDALDPHLGKPLAGLYVITSDEHLLALEAADKIRKTARTQGFSEREVLVVDRSFKWGELLAANQSQSLFGDKKLIELRIPTGKPGQATADRHCRNTLRH